jgi:NAD(P)H-dependent FMN reductase
MPDVIGLGGSLRAASTSRAALQVTLEGAAAGAATRLAREQGLSLTGPDGLLKHPTRQPKLTRTWTCCVAVTMSTAATFALPRTARPPSPR